MSLLDRTRPAASTTPAPATPAPAALGGPLRLRAAFAGVWSAGVSLLAIALPVLLAWVASAQSTVQWTQALGVGAGGWLLAHGIHLGAGTATISLTPWLLSAVPLAVATVAARRTVAQLGEGKIHRMQGLGRLRRDIGDLALGFLGGYAASVLGVAAATWRGPVRPSLPTVVLGALVLPAVAVLLAVILELRSDLRTVAPDLSAGLRAILPVTIRRALGPAVFGFVSALALGLALVVGVLVVHAERVAHLYGALHVDLVGAVLLSVGQLLLLPNAAVWALSWMAGPGFGIGDGSSVTWATSDPGLLPLVPGLGALPAPGPMPPGLWLSAAVPVLVGMLVGWRSLRTISRLSAWRLKAETAAAACVLTAALVAVAGALAGGSVGAARLTTVGVSPLQLGAAVLGELLLGAAVTVAVSHWWTSHR